MSQVTVFLLCLVCIQIISIQSQQNTVPNNNSTGVHLKEVKEINGKAKLDEYFSKNKRAIIEIYAPWCHHCQVFAPVYKQLYNEFIHEIDFIRIDGSTPSNYGSLTRISGFPTIFIYDNKKLFEYQGGLDKENVKNFIRKYNFSCQKITNNIDSFIKENDKKEFILGIFDQQSELIDYFQEMNAHNRLMIQSCFYIVNTSKSINPETNKSLANQIIVSNSQGKISHFYELNKANSLLNDKKYLKYFVENVYIQYGEFLKINYFPLVGNVDNSNLSKYRKRGFDYIIFTYFTESERVLFETISQQVSILLGFSQKYSILSYQIAKDGVFQGFDFNNYACVVICEPNFFNIEILRHSEKFNLESVIEFIKNSAVYEKNTDVTSNKYKSFKELKKITYKTAKIISHEEMKKEVEEIKKKENAFLQLPQKENIEILEKIKMNKVASELVKNETVNNTLNTTKVNTNINMTLNREIIKNIIDKKPSPNYTGKRDILEFFSILFVYSVLFFFFYRRFFTEKDVIKTN